MCPRGSLKALGTKPISSADAFDSAPWALTAEPSLAPAPASLLAKTQAQQAALRFNCCLLRGRQARFLRHLQFLAHAKTANARCRLVRRASPGHSRAGRRSSCYNRIRTTPAHCHGIPSTQQRALAHRNCLPRFTLKKATHSREHAFRAQLA